MIQLLFLFFLSALSGTIIYSQDKEYRYIHQAYHVRSSEILKQLGNSAIPSESIVSTALLEKLFVITGDSFNLHKKICAHIITHAGSSVSIKLLRAPTHHQRDIIARQSAIQVLTSDTNLYNLVRSSLQEINSCERYFFQLYFAPISSWEEFQSTLLPVNKLSNYNQSATALGLFYWQKRLSTMFFPLLYEWGISCVDHVIKEAKTKKASTLETIWQGIKKGSNFYAEDIKSTYSALVQPKLLFNQSIQETQSKALGTMLFGIRMSRIITYPHFAYTVHKLKTTSKAELVKELQKHIDDIYKLLEHTQLLYAHCISKKELTLIHSLAKTEEILRMYLPKFRELYQETKKKSVWAYFCNNANLIAAYTYLETIKSELIYLYEFIGELDTYCSLAALMRTHQDHKTEPYCFVKFLDSKSPELTLTGFWNPLVNNNQTVNTLNFKNGSNVLLEGPHASGKSTVTRAIAYNFVLMHCFGIAAAQQACGTIFDRFISYSNVSENPALKLSGFDAQLREIITLREAIEASEKTGQKLFCFLDEPLTGTMEEAGAQELRAFCGFLSKQKNTVCLLATHFNNVTSDQFFKPSYMACDEINNTGTFARKYLVMPGKHPWWYQDSAQRTKYITWMLQNARTALGYGK